MTEALPNVIPLNVKLSLVIIWGGGGNIAPPFKMNLIYSISSLGAALQFILCLKHDTVTPFTFILTNV